MLPRLRTIPDSVDEFTGFALEWDPIAGELPGGEPYAATGDADVRNVTLPADYSHVALPLADHLAADAATRAWIDAYAPATATPGPSPDAAADTCEPAARRRHLVQRQAALVPRGAAADPRASRPP